MANLICPVCEEDVLPGRPVRDLFGVDRKRLENRHKDGEPLCPVMTLSGYQPALPTQRKAK